MNLECFIVVLRDYIFIIPGAGVEQLALEREEVVLVVFWEPPDFLLVTQAGADLVPSVAGAHLRESSE